MSSNGPVSRPASNAAPTAAPAPTAAAAAAPSDTPTSSPTTPGWRVMPDVAWRPRWPPTWFKDPGRFCELESIRQWVKDFFLYKWVPLGDGSYVLRRFKVRERTLSGDATEWYCETNESKCGWCVLLGPGPSLLLQNPYHGQGCDSELGADQRQVAALSTRIRSEDDMRRRTHLQQLCDAPSGTDSATFCFVKVAGPEQSLEEIIRGDFLWKWIDAPGGLPQRVPVHLEATTQEENNRTFRCRGFRRTNCPWSLVCRNGVAVVPIFHHHSNACSSHFDAPLLQPQPQPIPQTQQYSPPTVQPHQSPTSTAVLASAETAAAAPPAVQTSSPRQMQTGAQRRNAPHRTSGSSGLLDAVVSQQSAPQPEAIDLSSPTLPTAELPPLGGDTLPQHPRHQQQEEETASSPPQRTLPPTRASKRLRLSLPNSGDVDAVSREEGSPEHAQLQPQTQTLASIEAPPEAAAAYTHSSGGRFEALDSDLMIKEDSPVPPSHSIVNGTSGLEAASAAGPVPAVPSGARATPPPAASGPATPEPLPEETLAGSAQALPESEVPLSSGDTSSTSMTQRAASTSTTFHMRRGGSSTSRTTPSSGPGEVPPVPASAATTTAATLSEEDLQRYEVLFDIQALWRQVVTRTRKAGPGEAAATAFAKVRQDFLRFVASHLDALPRQIQAAAGERLRALPHRHCGEESTSATSSACAICDLPTEPADDAGSSSIDLDSHRRLCGLNAWMLDRESLELALRLLKDTIAAQAGLYIIIDLRFATADQDGDEHSPGPEDWPALALGPSNLLTLLRRGGRGLHKQVWRPKERSFYMPPTPRGGKTSFVVFYEMRLLSEEEAKHDEPAVVRVI